MTTGPYHYTEAARLTTMAHRYTYGDGADTAVGNALASEAVANAINGLTAATVMAAQINAAVADIRDADLEAWAEVIPPATPKECWGQDVRRSKCAERHTEDCAYADPVPEPKHELLPVGTRVLVSERRYEHEDFPQQPYAAKIVGYDMHHTKYRLHPADSWKAGAYVEVDRWAFADNRVQVHPDGHEYQPPQLVNTEPTGPRMYVQNQRGKQGYILQAKRQEDEFLVAQVQWLLPGVQPVWVDTRMLVMIAPEDVERCVNGQTGDECGSGENRCEPCLQAEDAEGDATEESMGL